MRKPIGMVISGSLSEGILLRINPLKADEPLNVGSFVTIQTETTIFFSLLSDLRSSIAHPDVALFPPSPTEDILVQNFFTLTALIKPVLVLDAATNNIVN